MSTDKYVQQWARGFEQGQKVAFSMADAAPYMTPTYMGGAGGALLGGLAGGFSDNTDENGKPKGVMSRLGNVLMGAGIGGAVGAGGGYLYSQYGKKPLPGVQKAPTPKAPAPAPLSPGCPGLNAGSQKSPAPTPVNPGTNNLRQQQVPVGPVGPGWGPRVVHKAMNAVFPPHSYPLTPFINPQ